MKPRAIASILQNLTVTDLPVAALKPNPRNARTHSDKQVQQVANSIREFGFTNPVLIDENNVVMAGHCRLLAAKLLGMNKIPTIRLDHMTAAQKRAYLLADNKLGLNAGWDGELLPIELDYLSNLNLDFDITLTGFETPEIDLLLEQYRQGPDPADAVPEIDPDSPTVTQAGDLWLIGKHRLLCADATQTGSFSTLMEGQLASLVFIDPPYNVRIDGHVCGLGKTKHREFQMASGEMSEAQFTTFLSTVFSHLDAHSVEGSIHFVCMDWRHISEILAAAKSTYTELKNLCVWNKSNAGMGSLYRSKHELVFVFKSGTQAHINNIELGKHGRYRTNVWDYEGVNTLHASRREELSLHPTVKPVAMVADAIQDCSKRKQIVLDCFAGSGTTLIAAEKTGRCGYGMELDPRYVDTILNRMHSVYGLSAIHAKTGLDFTTVREKRFLLTKPKRRKTSRVTEEVSDGEI